MVRTIKRIGVQSCGKIFGILYAFIGLIIGAFLSLFALVGSALSETGMGIFGAMFGVGAIIILPIFYGLIGFIGGMLMALLYNLVVGWVGGLEVETE